MIWIALTLAYPLFGCAAASIFQIIWDWDIDRKFEKLVAIVIFWPLVCSFMASRYLFNRQFPQFKKGRVEAEFIRNLFRSGEAWRRFLGAIVHKQGGVEVDFDDMNAVDLKDELLAHENLELRKYLVTLRKAGGDG